MLAELDFGFQIICLTESWFSADADSENIYELPGYTSVHQVRNHEQGVRFVFFHDSLISKLQPDHSIRDRRDGSIFYRNY